MMRVPIAALTMLLVAACSAGASPTDNGSNASALIHQVTPRRGTLDEIVTAYGQATAGPGGARALTLPVDAVLVSVDVVAGQRVRSGQALARVDAGPAARSNAAQARTALALAVDQRDRTARLLASHLSSNEQMAQAEKAVADARAALDAQAMPPHLMAPADGTVATIDAVRGALVAAGAPLITFSDSAQVACVAGIEPSDMQRVRPGHAVLLVPIGGGATIAAKVGTVGSVVNASTRLVDVSIRPALPLVPGMVYRATIVIGARSGWLLPVDAIVGDEGKQKVWQVKVGRALGVPVTVVDERNAQALVEGTIDPDLPLVTAGAPQLEEGMQVRPEGGP